MPNESQTFRERAEYLLALQETTGENQAAIEAYHERVAMAETKKLREEIAVMAESMAKTRAIETLPRLGRTINGEEAYVVSIPSVNMIKRADDSYSPPVITAAVTFILITSGGRVMELQGRVKTRDEHYNPQNPWKILNTHQLPSDGWTLKRKLLGGYGRVVPLVQIENVNVLKRISSVLNQAMDTEIQKLEGRQNSLEQAAETIGLSEDVVKRLPARKN